MHVNEIDFEIPESSPSIWENIKQAKLLSKLMELIGFKDYDNEISWDVLNQQVP